MEDINLSDADLDLSSLSRSTFDPDWMEDREVKPGNTSLSSTDISDNQTSQVPRTIPVGEPVGDTECNFDLTFEDEIDEQYGEMRGDNVVLNPEYESQEENGLEPIQSSDKKSKINWENLSVNTDEYLKNNEPKNTAISTKSALNSFNSVMAEVAKHKNEQFVKLEDIRDEDLPDRLEMYVRVVVKEDGSSLNAGTLTTYFNSLRRQLKLDRAMDIKTDPRFFKLNKALARRQEESCSNGEIPGKNASRSIPVEDFAKARAAGTIGTASPKALVAAVTANFIFGFGVRAKAELYNMKNSDIELGPINKEGLPEFLQLSERITKTRRGNQGLKGARAYKPTISLDNDNKEKCMVRPFLEMQRKKPKVALDPNRELFLACKNIQNPSDHSIWYSNSRFVFIRF